MVSEGKWSGVRTLNRLYPGCNGPVTSGEKSAGVDSEQDSFQSWRSCMPDLAALGLGGGISITRCG